MSKSPTVSCALATNADSPAHIELAERLGYSRAWLFDAPQQGADVWLTLALAAQRTQRIGLGPGVLVPSLRHPMVNATQTRSLQAMAPGRLSVAFGTGFTGRRAMGKNPLTWKYVADYLAAYLGLLRGETVSWDGARMKMMPSDPDEPWPAPPPILLAANGPRGAQHAKDLQVDGLFSFPPVSDFLGQFTWSALLLFGTVLDPGEAINSERVKAAAGPALGLTYHYTYSLGGEDAVRNFPGGAEFLAVIDKIPAEERHLAVHDGHLARVNNADAAAWDAGSHTLLSQLTLTGTPDVVAGHIARFVAQGATEIIYQPIGPDIPRELERFMQAVAAGTGPLSPASGAPAPTDTDRVAIGSPSDRVNP